MTVFRPTPAAKIISLHLAIFSTGLLLLATLFGWLMLYNQIVDTSHALGEKTSELNSLKVKQADLSDELSRLLNPVSLPDLAVNHGLVKESHPQFVYAGE